MLLVIYVSRAPWVTLRQGSHWEESPLLCLPCDVMGHIGALVQPIPRRGYGFTVAVRCRPALHSEVGLEVHGRMRGLHADARVIEVAPTWGGDAGLVRVAYPS